MKLLRFFKKVFSHFFKSNTYQKGAALSYYSVFSFIPMTLIIISLLGLFFGEQAISGEVYLKLKDFLGAEASLQIQDLIKNQHIQKNSLLTTLVGIVVLLFSATGMFKQVHNSLNSIWGLKAKSTNGTINFLARHFSSIIVIILLFLIIFISTSITSFIVKYSGDYYYINKLSFVYEHIITCVFISLNCFIIFLFFGDAKVNWKAALVGGMFTSVLFLIGKIGVGLYIGNIHLSSTFGSASVLALLMIWVYYISQILFLGACFVKVYSDYLGVEITPNENAVKVEEIEINS